MVLMIGTDNVTRSKSRKAEKTRNGVIAANHIPREKRHGSVRYSSLCYCWVFMLQSWRRGEYEDKRVGGGRPTEWDHIACGIATCRALWRSAWV